MKLRKATRFTSLRGICRMLALAVFAAALSSFAGCQASGSVSVAQSTPNSASSISDSAQTNEQVRSLGDLRDVPNGYTNFYGANTGNAYYELVNIDYFGKTLLLKTDYATGVQTCLCNIPDCTHMDKSCNAFVEGVRGNKLFATEDALYLLHESPYVPIQSADLEVQEKMGWVNEISYIERISLDGAQRIRVLTFPENLNVTYVCADDRMVYGSYSKTGEPENVGGFWADLHTGEFELFDTGGAALITHCDNALVGIQLTSEQDLDALLNTDFNAYMAAFQNANYEYSGLNPFTGERKLLAADSAMSILICERANGKRYATHLGESGEGESFSVLDFATGQETVLLTNIKNIMFGAITENKLVFGPDGASVYTPCGKGEDGEAQQFNALLNLTNGEIHEVTLRLKDGVSMPRPIAQTQDGRWLLQMDLLFEESSERHRYALIHPEDYLANKPNYQEVKMYEMPKA